MDTAEAVAVLRAHNEWRRDDTGSLPMGDTLKIGVAIDALCDDVERLRGLIAAHVNASNNDDSAGDTFGALVAEGKLFMPANATIQRRTREAGESDCNRLLGDMEDKR